MSNSCPFIKSQRQRTWVKGFCVCTDPKDFLCSLYSLLPLCLSVSRPRSHWQAMQLILKSSAENQETCLGTAQTEAEWTQDGDEDVDGDGTDESERVTNVPAGQRFANLSKYFLKVINWTCWQENTTSSKDFCLTSVLVGLIAVNYSNYKAKYYDCS